MFRNACLIAVLLVAGAAYSASAQTATPAATPPAATAPAAAPAGTPATTPAKPSRLKLTVQRLKEMKAKWSANRPKLAACRKDVKIKGLTGDDRWFSIADCMEKT